MAHVHIVIELNQHVPLFIYAEIPAVSLGVYAPEPILCLRTEPHFPKALGRQIADNRRRVICPGMARIDPAVSSDYGHKPACVAGVEGLC